MGNKGAYSHYVGHMGKRVDIWVLGTIRTLVRIVHMGVCYTIGTSCATPISKRENDFKPF